MNIAIKLDLFQYIFPVFEKYNWRDGSISSTMRLSSGSPREKRSFIFFGRCAKVAVYKRLFWTTALLDGKGENLPFWRTLWRTVGWEVRTSPTPSTLVPANQTHTDERVPCLADDGVRNTLLDSRWTRRRSYKVLWAREPRDFFSFFF